VDHAGETCKALHWGPTAKPTGSARRPLRDKGGIRAAGTQRWVEKSQSSYTRGTQWRESALTSLYTTFTTEQ